MSYHGIERLYQGPRTTVYRARQDADDSAVLIHVPHVNTRENLDREKAVLERIGIPVAEAVGSQVAADVGRVLVVKDPGGHTLDTRVGRCTTAEVLELAISLAERLRVVHAQRIIIKDLNPSNVIISSDGSVELASYGLAIRLSRETRDLVHPDALEGRLEYISPEQTGRMNRATDYRADFYSFGAVLYALTTGNPPFRSDDPLELVHAHLARAPLSPAEYGVPAGLSDIILRLLAKSAQDRYQSAAGVAHDLRECQRRLSEFGEITQFELGQSDVSDLFHTPQRLYGREPQVGQILKAFSRVASGTTEFVLVSGYSGIGKSALVRETYKPVVENRGLFISGKPDQYQRNIPYAAWAGAVSELVRQLLTESKASIRSWRARILAATGENVALLCRLVPQLEHIVGAQAPVSPLPSGEAEARLNSAFTNFLGVFAAARPLVVLLDDLQWADMASLKLIQHLATARHGLSLLLVGAYRDNEVSDAHPLALALVELRKTPVVITDIVLEPLSSAATAELVADTLSTDPKEVGDLAELLRRKTGSNPFFLLQFFATIYDEGILEYDVEEGHWRWDLAKIYDLESTDNVVQLTLSRLRKLPADTQEALKVASCIGNRFSLEQLSMALSVPKAETLHRLWPSVESGHVVRPIAEDKTTGFRFLHDRVQEAAYELVARDQRRRLHHRIGTHLWRGLNDDELADQLFDVCGHLNRGSDLLTDDERLRLSGLNLKAAIRAQDAGAHDAAHALLLSGSRLLGDDGWTHHYELMSALQLHLSECEYALQNTGAAHALFDEVLTHSKTITEKVRVYVLQSQLFRHHARYAEALESCMAGLALLDVKIPAHTDAAALGGAVGEAGAELGELFADITVADCATLPEMTDAARLLEADLLEELSILGMFFTPLLAALSTVKLVALSIKHGNCRASAAAYASHGMAIGSGAGQYELGYQFGKMGLKLARHRGDTHGEVRSLVWFGALTSHWTTHVDESLRLLKHGVDLGIRIGATVWASYCAFFAPIAEFYSGAMLETVRRSLLTYMVPMGEQSMTAAVCYQQVIGSLTGRIPGRGDLNDDDFDEEKHLETMAAGQVLALQHYFTVKAFGLVIFNRMDDAAALAKRAAAAGDVAMILFGQMAAAWSPFLRAMAILSSDQEELSDDDRETLAAMVARVDTYATHGEHNFGAFKRLLSAEQARRDGDQLAALDFYDQTIEAARSGRFLHIEALALERLARFHLANGRSAAFGRVLRSTRRCYFAWGAVSKVAALEEEFSDLLGLAGGGSGGGFTPSLDFQSVLKASRALSGEMEKDALLARSIDILIENAGAERGILMLVKDGELEVAMSSHPEDARYPRSVTDYCMRTGQAVVLSDATASDLFGRDPYVLERRPRSVLAATVSSQNRPIGVLYLENNLSSGAFTRGRVEVLEALSAQVAVSIENANLYEAQRQMAQSFARFVPQEFLQHLGRKSVLEIQRGDTARRNITVMFTDLRGFTTMSERMTPSESFATLNAYLECMEPVIKRHRGFVDKYLGDGIMALFPQSPGDALRAAIGMSRAMEDHNADRHRQDQPPLAISIGLHQGPCVLGTLGSGDRLETTVVGDTVNVAARLESLTRHFGSTLLVSEETMGFAGERFASRLVGRVRVRGRAAPLRVHQVLDALPGRERVARTSTLTQFNAGVDAFMAGDLQSAIGDFQACLQLGPDDSLAANYIERCRNAFGTPLVGDWDVVDQRGQ